MVKEREVRCRTNKVKARTDVVHGRENCGEVCREVIVFDRDKKDRSEEDDHERNEEYVDRTNDFMLYRFAVHLDLADALRMDVVLEFFADGLDEDDETGDFDTAAR